MISIKVCRDEVRDFTAVTPHINIRSFTDSQPVRAPSPPLREAASYTFLSRWKHKAPGANAYNASKLSYKLGVLVCKCFRFACRSFILFLFSFLFCYVLFVLFCVLLYCSMHASVCISSSEALASLTSSVQTLIEINSFDQLVTKTYPRCVDLTADCCTSMNEVVQY